MQVSGQHAYQCFPNSVAGSVKRTGQIWQSMSLFRLAGVVALCLIGFLIEMCCVVCREHFVAGLHLNMFVVCFCFF